MKRYLGLAWTGPPHQAAVRNVPALRCVWLALAMKAPQRSALYESARSDPPLGQDVGEREPTEAPSRLGGNPALAGREIER